MKCIFIFSPLNTACLMQYEFFFFYYFLNLIKCRPDSRHQSQSAHCSVQVGGVNASHRIEHTPLGPIKVMQWSPCVFLTVLSRDKPHSAASDTSNICLGWIQGVYRAWCFNFKYTGWFVWIHWYQVYLNRAPWRMAFGCSHDGLVIMFQHLRMWPYQYTLKIKFKKC